MVMLIAASFHDESRLVIFESVLINVPPQYIWLLEPTINDRPKRLLHRYWLFNAERLFAPVIRN
jgi:hypothetical protein